jgi:translation elongation factor EF-Tu-like GTPase
MSLEVRLSGGVRKALRRNKTTCSAFARRIYFARRGRLVRHPDYSAQCLVLGVAGTPAKEEGGRSMPFFRNYRPQLYFRTADVTGTIVPVDGVDMVMPGDNAVLAVELDKPVAIEESPASRSARATAPSARAS